ncbi:penton [Cafeteriavirus-dependent mavirus]|nr:penton [Cafeteriavirus-dependent mavirus]CAK6624545.1 penton [Cafeteriavirus-dependent mavirus]
MKSFIYLNEGVRGSKETAGIKGSYKQQIKINVNKSSNILDMDKKYLVSVEHFKIEKVRMPLFKPARVEYQVGILNTSTDEMVFRDVDFSTFVEDDGFMYDFKDVATAIHETITALCETETTVPEADIPTFGFNKSSLRFEITSTLNFRDNYGILFNDDLRVDFGSFEFDRIDELYEMVVLSGDVETQDSKTLEFLCPISYVVIESSDLPVEYELLPPISKNTSVSDNTGVFLTNYTYEILNNQDYVYIVFNSSTTIHRYHNITQNNFSKFDLSFTMYDYDNNKYPIILLPQTVANVKLMFESIEE